MITGSRRSIVRLSNSPIIRQAHRVREGGCYEADGAVFRVVGRAYDQDILNAGILLCWTNKTRFALNAQARALRGITSALPQVGEPLLCLRNHRWSEFTAEVSIPSQHRSKAMVTITVNVDGIPRSIRKVAFDPTEQSRDDDSLNTSFNHGYAATVHSAAGSEWDNVVWIDGFHGTDDERRRWQYTAITRATKRITVVRRY